VKQVFVTLCAGIALGSLISTANAEVIIPQKEIHPNNSRKYTQHANDARIPGISRAREKIPQKQEMIISQEAKKGAFGISPELGGCMNFFLLTGLISSQEVALHACTQHMK